jgi:hypothetical protein
MWFILFMVVALLLAVGLCLHHYKLKQDMVALTAQDADQVRRACDASLAAAHVHRYPHVALLWVEQAITRMEALHDRYTPRVASELCHVDTAALLSEFRRQKARIVRTVRAEHPRLLPDHPVKGVLGDDVMYGDDDDADDDNDYDTAAEEEAEEAGFSSEGESGFRRRERRR